MDEEKINTFINLLNEKEVLLKEREQALEDQQEEFQSQKEELTAAVEELIAKNSYLTTTLEKLKQRNFELDDILYRASHDLKTPVTSIYGLIEILRAGPLTDDQQFAITHLLEQTRQTEKRLISLTNLSVAFFTEPKLQSFSLHQLVVKTWNTIDGRHEIKMDFVSDDRQLCTDPFMLSILFRCLFENSIIFRNNSTSAYVSVSCVKIGDTVVIDIRDNGDGIDPSIESRIFDMFYRGSEKSKGFGIGLYISRTIVRRLNGNIQYVSGESETVFRLSLPA